MRAIPQAACSANDNSDNIKGIVYYGSSTDTPSTTGYSYTDECVDESDLVPFFSRTVGDVDQEALEAVSIGSRADNANYATWTLNTTSFLVNWEDPVSFFSGDDG
jgi:hypothetical protein